MNFLAASLDMPMTKAGLIVYFCLVALSHVAFGIFSTEHRVKKPIVYLAYALFFAFFLGIGALELKFSILFIIIFSVYVVLYVLLSKGVVLKKLFGVTSYLTFIIIFFGVTFSALFITGPGYITLRWLIIIFYLLAFEVFLYMFLIPRFHKAELNVDKGWGLILIGDVLFLLIIFMQIFYPFHLNEKNPWTIVIFLLSAAIYFFVVSVVLVFFSTSESYKKEKEKNYKLEVLAHKDSLTSLYNRAYFEIYTEYITNNRTKDSTDTTVVVVMDINKFKEINDTYGHSRGDKVLIEVANIIKSNFNTGYYECFRVGGDEFVLVGTNIEKQDLDERILAMNLELKDKIDISIAVGYNYVDFDNIDAIRTAFKKADKQMYKHKYR